VTTIIESDPENLLSTQCRFDIGFEAEQGFTIKSYTAIRWDMDKGIALHEVTPISLKSIHDLPNNYQMKRIAKRLASNHQKKRPGKRLR
jgi:hypothetical protein